MTVYAYLTLAELPAELSSAEASLAATEKAAKLMDVRHNYDEGDDDDDDDEGDADEGDDILLFL